MRVISGKFKKKKLLLPDPKITRPLRDYVKESLFNLLTHTKSLNFKFDKSVVLDVFSGSGSFGIECLSRGSEKVVFIEKNQDSLATLNKNTLNQLFQSSWWKKPKNTDGAGEKILDYYAQINFVSSSQLISWD